MENSSGARPARRSRVWPVVTAALIGALAFSLSVANYGYFSTILLPLLIAAAVVVAGWSLLRLRRERAEHEAALTRWAATEAVLDERLHIARDLHDIVSHGLGMITVAATAAKHLDAQRPDHDRLLHVLDDIEGTSRDATRELRRMLEVLRDPDAAAPNRPAETLDSLPDIIGVAERAGLDVSLDQTPLGTVSAGVQLTVCAVVREALSNILRHAGPTRAHITIARSDDAVSVTVTDDGPAREWGGAPGAGHGLTGLRERITALGGTLDAEPSTAGFRIEARIPDTETAV